MYQAPNTRYKVLIYHCLNQCMLSTVYRVLSMCTQFLQTILSSVYLSLLCTSLFWYRVTSISTVYCVSGARYLYRVPSNNPVYQAPNTRSQSMISSLYQVPGTCIDFLQTILSSMYLSLLRSIIFNVGSQTTQVKRKNYALSSTEL